MPDVGRDDRHVGGDVDDLRGAGPRGRFARHRLALRHGLRRAVGHRLGAAAHLVGQDASRLPDAAPRQVAQPLRLAGAALPALRAQRVQIDADGWHHRDRRDRKGQSADDAPGGAVGLPAGG
eukprot:scaffold58476_cov36-Phaeocystis_antarctica.AAC.1